jgi:hypothetical protein
MFSSLSHGSLVCQSRDIRLVIRKVFDSQQVPTFPFLLLFFLALLNLPIGYVTTILLEVLELVRYGTKALLSEETVWLEDLGLTNKEVTPLELRVFC